MDCAASKQGVLSSYGTPLAAPHRLAALATSLALAGTKTGAGAG